MSGKFKLTAWRNPDGSLARAPYVQTDPGHYVCQGYQIEDRFAEFERLVNQANAFNELLAALEDMIPLAMLGKGEMWDEQAEVAQHDIDEAQALVARLKG